MFLLMLYLCKGNFSPPVVLLKAGSVGLMPRSAPFGDHPVTQFRDSDALLGRIQKGLSGSCKLNGLSQSFHKGIFCISASAREQTGQPWAAEAGGLRGAVCEPCQRGHAPVETAGWWG